MKWGFFTAEKEEKERNPAFEIRKKHSTFQGQGHKWKASEGSAFHACGPLL